MTAEEFVSLVRDALDPVVHRLKEELGANVDLHSVICVNGRPVGVATLDDNMLRVADILGSAGMAMLQTLAIHGNETARTVLRDSMNEALGFEPPNPN